MLPTVDFTAKTSTFKTGYEFIHLTSIKKYDFDYEFSPKEFFYIPLKPELNTSFIVYPKPYTFFPFVDDISVPLVYQLARLDDDREEATLVFNFRLSDVNQTLRNEIVSSGFQNIRLVAYSILDNSYKIAGLETTRLVTPVKKDFLKTYAKLIFVFNASGSGDIEFKLKTEQFSASDVLTYNVKTSSFNFASEQEYYAIITFSDNHTKGSIQFLSKTIFSDPVPDTNNTLGANLVLSKTSNGFTNTATLYKSNLELDISSVSLERKNGTAKIGNFLIYGCQQ